MMKNQAAQQLVYGATHLLYYHLAIVRLTLHIHLKAALCHHHIFAHLLTLSHPDQLHR
jgi:hypothetical protein